MRRSALAFVLVALAAGCASGAKTGGTHLTLMALNPNVGKAVFHLDCPPPGATVSAGLASATAACDELRSDPSLITAPKPFTCIGGPTSWFDVTISGRFAGKPVREKFPTCWTPQMPTLGKLGLFQALGRHIIRRRHGRVPADGSIKFPSGALRPGDLLTCTIRGHYLKLGVPDHAGSLGSTGFGGNDVVSVTLSGTRHPDSSITASCRDSNS